MGHGHGGGGRLNKGLGYATSSTSSGSDERAPSLPKRRTEQPSKLLSPLFVLPHAANVDEPFESVYGHSTSSPFTDPIPPSSPSHILISTHFDSLPYSMFKETRQRLRYMVGSVVSGDIISTPSAQQYMREFRYVTGFNRNPFAA